MNFKEFFLEAFVDPNFIIQTDEEFPVVINKKNILDQSGQIVHKKGEIISRNINKDYDFYVVSPKYKYLKLHGKSPFVPEFKQFIAALKNIYPDIYRWKIDVLGKADMDTGKKNKEHRTVGFYLRHEPINFKNVIPKFLYHGTCTNLYLGNIKKEGLKPRNLTASMGSYGAEDIESLSRSNLVYLSVHPDASTRYAAISAAQRHGGQPLILRIHAKSNLFPDKFTFDEDDTKAIVAQDSVNTMGTLAYQGRIPASIIEPFRIGSGKGFYGDNYIWNHYKGSALNDNPWTEKLNRNVSPKNGSAEYYIFKYAGFIDNEGKKIKTVTNDEVVQTLKDSKWIISFLKFENDTRKGRYLEELHGLVISPKMTEQEKMVLECLVQCGLYKMNRNILEWVGSITTEEEEDKLVKLAQITFRKFDPDEFLEICKKINENYLS